MKKHLIFILLIIVTTSSCKKYEEDPFGIHFRSPYKRIYGTWEVKSFMINNEESINIYNDSCGCNFRFHHEGSYQYLHLQDCILPGEIGGRPSLENDMNILVLNFSIFPPGFGIGPIDENEPIYWNILRLTNKEFWIKTNYNTKEYKMKLKKIKDDK